MRGRDYERNIPDEYLSHLNRYYDEWMESYQMGNKLIIDSDDLDFLHKKEDFDHIAQRIIQSLDQRDLFLEARASQSQGSASSVSAEFQGSSPAVFA